MKWMGVVAASVLMGLVMAVLALTTFPSMPIELFLLAALASAVVIFALMARFTQAAGEIEVRHHYQWDGREYK